MRPSEIACSELTGADPRMGSTLDRLVEEFRGIDRLVAVAVPGSVPAGNADRFSDLDLQCVFRGLTPEGAQGIHRALHHVLPIGDQRWTAPGRILSTVTHDWFRVDVSLLDLTEPISHTSLPVGTQDQIDLLRSPPPTFSPDPDGLTRQITRFLRSVGLIVRDLHRGDIRLGCFATEFLVDDLISLMYMQCGLVRGSQKGTYEQLPKSDVDILQRLTVAEADAASIVHAQLCVANEYLPRAHRLVEEWGAIWPKEMFTGTRAFLLAHLDATFDDVRPERQSRPTWGDYETMRYFIDTEFDDWKPWPQLISIGLVADDGREYYAEFADFDRASAKPWVAEHVLPHLGPIEAAKPLSQIRSEVTDFFAVPPDEVWAVLPHYDWVLFHHGLFENMDHVPANVPLDWWDLRQWRHSLVDPPEPATDPNDKHHALLHARSAKAEYELLSRFAARER